MTLCTCGICLTAAAMLAVLWARPAALAQAIALAIDLTGRLLRRKLPTLLAICLALAATGCDEMRTPRVRALPVPPPEQPTCNLPAELHVSNWRGAKGEGSCVHASLKNHALWLNDFNFVRSWPWEDGEYASRLRARLDGHGYEYAYTEKYDPRFLDWCDQTRRGAILWWKPAHCCTFSGWVWRDGKQYAAILDNNYAGKYELHEREQFIRLWSGYGGFALCLLNSPPATSRPFKSYELY